jgi:hypothetical protein
MESHKRKNGQEWKEDEKRLCVEREKQSDDFDNMSKIPQEIREKILSYLDWKSILSFAGTNSFMRKVVRESARILFKNKGYGPTFAPFSYSITLSTLKNMHTMFRTSTIPCRFSKLGIHNTFAKSIRIPPDLDTFHFKSAPVMKALDLNGAKHIYIRNSTFGKEEQMHITGTQNVETAIFRNAFFARSFLDEYHSLHTCVFINTTFKNCVIRIPLKGVLFYRCKLTNCSFKNVETVCSMNSSFYRHPFIGNGMSDFLGCRDFFSATCRIMHMTTCTTRTFSERNGVIIEYDCFVDNFHNGVLEHKRLKNVEIQPTIDSCVRSVTGGMNTNLSVFCNGPGFSISVD